MQNYESEVRLVFLSTECQHFPKFYGTFSNWHPGVLWMCRDYDSWRSVRGSIDRQSKDRNAYRHNRGGGFYMDSLSRSNGLLPILVRWNSVCIVVTVVVQDLAQDISEEILPILLDSVHETPLLAVRS